MTLTGERRYPVAHVPLVRGVLRQLDVAASIDHMIPSHPAHILSCGRGVEALVRALLDGQHARDKVGVRLAERGMLPVLQDGLGRASLHDDRLGPAPRCPVCGQSPWGLWGCRAQGAGGRCHPNALAASGHDNQCPLGRR